MDFDEIAEKQGWSQQTILAICRDYISCVDGSSEFLAEFAKGIADEENN